MGRFLKSCFSSVQLRVLWALLLCFSLKFWVMCRREEPNPVQHNLFRFSSCAFAFENLFLLVRLYFHRVLCSLMLMRLNKKSSLIISNERRLISRPFNVLFSHQQNEYVLSFPLLLAFSTKSFYLLWFSNFSLNNYWAKSLLSFVLATSQHVRLSLGNHFGAKVIPSSGAWMLAVTNAMSLVFSPREQCGRRRNTDVCSSAGNIWLTKCTECCSKEDIFQTC